MTKKPASNKVPSSKKESKQEKTTKKGKPLGKDSVVYGVQECLKANPTISGYTAAQLADWIYVNCKKTIVKHHMKENGLTTDKDIKSRIVIDIYNFNKRFDQYGVTLIYDHPIKYVLTETLEREQKRNDDDEAQANDLERPLYDVLCSFCKTRDINAKKIEAGSAKKGKKEENMWLFADVVGYKNASREYSAETRNVMSKCRTGGYIFYSFEVKRGAVLKTNVRKYFFQAVANSSWANYSYLVAEAIDETAMEELQLLCESFKIGFILLKRTEENPINMGEVIIPAQKTGIDWGMIDRITETENEDFKEFLDSVM